MRTTAILLSLCATAALASSPASAQDDVIHGTNDGDVIGDPEMCLPGDAQHSGPVQFGDSEFVYLSAPLGDVPAEFRDSIIEKECGGKVGMMKLVCAALIPTTWLTVPVTDPKGKRCDYLPEPRLTLCFTEFHGRCPINRRAGFDTCWDARPVHTYCSICGEDQQFPAQGEKTPPVRIPTDQDINLELWHGDAFETAGQTLIAFQARQRALELVLTKQGWNDGTKVMYEPYNKSGRYGTIDAEKDIIYIAKTAFRSPAFLATVIGHERIHLQWRKMHPQGFSQNFWLHEAWAQLWVLTFQESLGMTPAEIKLLNADFRWKEALNNLPLGAECPDSSKLDRNGFKKK